MREGGDYSIVPACFEFQDLYEATFGRAFSKFPAAAKAFVRGLGKHERGVVREVAKDFNLMLSTYVLEDIGKEQMDRLLEERAVYWVAKSDK